MAVQTGFDTDCNGATLGSILGMRNGSAGVSETWTKPINGELNTSIFGVGKVKISDMVESTMSHMPKRYFLGKLPSAKPVCLTLGTFLKQNRTMQ